MIFLTATKDLQSSPAYERALKLLGERYGQGEVTADRNLFDSTKQWRKTFKEVFGKAEIMYIVARADGTVGLGLYKQYLYADKEGMPQVLMSSDEEGKLAGTGEHEHFGLERLNLDGVDSQDVGRFASIKL